MILVGRTIVNCSSTWTTKNAALKLVIVTHSNVSLVAFDVKPNETICIDGSYQINAKVLCESFYGTIRRICYKDPTRIVWKWILERTGFLQYLCYKVCRYLWGYSWRNEHQMKNGEGQQARYTRMRVQKNGKTCVARRTKTGVPQQISKNIRSTKLKVFCLDSDS